MKIIIYIFIAFFIFFSDLFYAQDGAPVEKKEEHADEKSSKGDLNSKDNVQKQEKINLQTETYIDENGETHTRYYKYGFQSSKKSSKPMGSSQTEEYIDRDGVNKTQKFKYDFQYSGKTASTEAPMLDLTPKPSAGFQKSKKKAVTPEPEENKIKEEEKPQNAMPDINEIKSQVEEMIKTQMSAPQATPQ